MLKNIYILNFFLLLLSIYVLSGKNGKHFKKQSQVSAEDAAKLKLFGAAGMDFQPNSAETNNHPHDANIEEEDESSDDSSSCDDLCDDDEVVDDIEDGVLSLVELILNYS